MAFHEVFLNFTALIPQCIFLNSKRINICLLARNVMTKFKNICYTTLQPLLTLLAVSLFLGIYYPHHMHFQEQFQLFLFDSGYAIDVMSVPGGVADYLGRFVTQFCLYAWVGASLIGALVALVQFLVVRYLGKGWVSCLSFLPAIFLVQAICNEHFLIGSIVAIILVLLSAWCCESIGQRNIRRIISILFLPLVYWLAGPISFLFVLLIAVNELRQEQNYSVIWFLVAILLVSSALPVFFGKFVAVEPQYMYSGIHYYRTHDNDMSPLCCSLFSIALIVVISAIYNKRISKEAKTLKPIFLSLVILVAGSIVIVYPDYNAKAEEGMAYDFMARFQQWNKIQQRAEISAPRNAITMTALNLALAQSGRLSERMFNYQQHGNVGLLPPFDRDAVSPLTTSEVYYHLGMINTAQRFVFEAQEAILDYQKSARCYKRLAETNLIRGNYKVAGKYLNALKKTLFYSQWAEETETLLGNEEAINNHREYGRLRKMICKEDFYYNGRNLPMMLGQLFESNRQNRLAFEYLEAECLLSKDLDIFVKNFSQNSEINYNTIPQHFQEALILWWSKSQNPEGQAPLGISQATIDRFGRFIKDANTSNGKVDLLRKLYGDTYWFYFLTN